MICRREDSARFLAGLLTMAEESTFVEHLETCTCCRAWLEEDAGGDAGWQSARELLSVSIASANASSAEHGANPDAALDAEWIAPTVTLGTLSFLAPSDDPAMMGRVGPYEISGVVGRGGAGIVLRGFDRALSRNVAIKVLDPAMAGVGAARQRFAREARAMAAISHEHVVPVYGVEEHAGLPYFVMEYVAGGSLERRLRTEGPVDVVSIVRIGFQTAQALAAAHAQGLVHRDIKPGNILLDRGTERVRVADFGLARVANDVSCTHSGFIAGTPQYMAPEQVRAETCDAQSDLFSLGGVMYALCTGHAPFRADTVYGVMQRIVHDEPRSIREQNPLVPDWLELFVLRLLAKDKAARLTSAVEVVQILQAELAHLQNPRLTPAPARPWQPAPRRPTRRGRRTWMVAGAVVGIALLIAGIGFWQYLGTRSPGDDGESKNAAGPSLSGLSAPSATVPLWGVEVDGLPQAVAQADALEAAWTTPSSHGEPDAWDELAGDIRRRLAELSAELESAKSAGTSPAK